MSVWMKALLPPVAFVLLVSAADQKPRLTFQGIGAIEIGMSSDQAKKLGFQLTSSGPWGEVGDEYFISCHYLDSSPTYPGISLMMSDGKVVRIDIGFGDDKSWKSYSGAKIGMSQSDVKAMYGDWLKVSSHPYLDGAGSYLRLDSGDGKYAMIFETATKEMTGDAANGADQTKYVTNFRSGFSGPVSYIEGCA